MPKRIQLKRTRGWRMPAGATSVARPGPWGNQFVVSQKVAPGKGVGGFYTAVPTVEDAVECFRLMLVENDHPMVAAARTRLRGLDLGCWCRLCDRHADGKPFGEECPDCPPCHGDVLGMVANG